MNRRELMRYLGAGGLALQPGARAMASLGAASQTVTPASIFTNQLGYQIHAAKQATVRRAIVGSRDFQVRQSSSNTVVFKVEFTAPSLDAASGDQVSIADFSPLRAPGTYRLEIDGIESERFSIEQQVYSDALRLVMRSFYGQRCGCAVDLGGGYKHPACHGNGGFHSSSGKSGRLVNPGGWHDAGDYGRYIVNSGVSTGTLLWAWELFPQALQNLSLDIPESGGKLPDYLAEVRWNLEWMLSLQDTDGGVWHKQTSEAFCGFIMPQNDTLTSYVIGTGNEPYKSTAATADLAAVMAIAARCYQPFDDVFAQRCLVAASLAWTWAMVHPNVPFENPPGISTGGYEDKHCADEITWATAELWRTTGEARYQKAFLAGLPDPHGPLTLTTVEWRDVASMAYWSYALAKDSAGSVLSGNIKQMTAKTAAALAERSSKNGYGNTLTLSDYDWGSNGTAANQSLLLLVANHFHPDSSLRNAALNNLHYLLGRNCHGVSWVTQLGAHPFEHPHHRPSIADHIAAPWPGLLSGGPNARVSDPVADKLPKQPPMRMWMDDEHAYSLNEVAINWNAPLVFLLAAANS